MAGRSYFDARVAQLGIGSPWDALIRSTAASLGLEPAIIKAVISAESNWNPTAVSYNASSYGLMQINVAAHGITIAQANDPAFAIPYASQLLLHQIQTRPSLDLAIAAYNAGTSRTNADLTARILGNVNGVGTYVATVLDFMNWFLANDVAGPQPGFVLPTMNFGVTPDATAPPLTQTTPAPGDAGAAPFPGRPDDGAAGP
jgi:soluble lytic murein transglycosylase-like protein